jgi:hypothetical protein
VSPLTGDREFESISLQRRVRCEPHNTAVTAFLLTAVFGLLWANAGSEAMVLAIGFGMIF